MNFKKRLITPLWPAAIGLAERFMRNLNKVIRRAKVENLPWILQEHSILNDRNDSKRAHVPYMDSDVYLYGDQTSMNQDQKNIILNSALDKDY